MTIRLLLALLVVSLSACATTGEPDSNQRFATLVTSGAPMKLRSHAVEVSRIDDRRLNLGQFNIQLKQFENSRAVHRIKPGTHTIFGIPIIRDDYGVSPRLSGLDRRVLPLTANFESGVRYHLAIQRSDVDRRKWQVVIWKEEETDQGLLDLD